MANYVHIVYIKLSSSEYGIFGKLGTAYFLARRRRKLGLGFYE